MVTTCINNIQPFNYQLTHTTLKNVELLKHSKISKTEKTNLKIAFWPTNTIYQKLSNKTKDPNPTGIYQLKCSTCICWTVRWSYNHMT